MMSTDHHASDHCRFNRAVLLRVFLVLCIGIYSVAQLQSDSVIVHDHHESHADYHSETHHAPDPHHDEHENHEDHHDGEEGEHHHHLSFTGNVAMASVTPPSHDFSLRVTLLNATSINDVCPSGPVFELIKPPQAS